MTLMGSIDDNKQDIVIAWTVAILVHALFFTLSGKMFIKPVQFAIAPSREIDINLMVESKEVIKVEEQQKPAIKKSVALEKIISQVQKQLLTPRAQVKVEARPDYIQNPPPAYPELAKKMRQGGMVMLSVDVDRAGDPVNVEIIQSSGYSLLDQAASKAVRHWKFQPGSIGSVPVESTVTVPIRFRLER